MTAANPKPETTEQPGFWDDAEIISEYSRAQALDDGFLVDVTEWAKETGYLQHTVFTRALWDTCEPPKSNKIQSIRGRAHDVLYMGFMAMRRAKAGDDRVLFRVKIGRKLHTLLLHVGPGDTPEPVLTVGFPNDF